MLCVIVANFTCSKGLLGDDTRKMPLRFDWPTIRNTRLNKCNEMNLCPVCAESSRFGRLNQAPITIIHKKPGRPRVTSPQKSSNYVINV